MSLQLHGTIAFLRKTGTGDLKGLLQRYKPLLLCAVASASQDRRYQSLLYLHPSSPFPFSSHLFPQIDMGAANLYLLHTFFKSYLNFLLAQTFSYLEKKALPNEHLCFSFSTGFLFVKKEKVLTWLYRCRWLRRNRICYPRYTFNFICYSLAHAL